MRYFLAFLLIFLTGYTSLAQDKLIMQHTKRKRKQKELSLEKNFTFKYLVDEYAYGKVIRFTETNLTVLTQMDSTEVTIDFADIDVIERDIHQNRRWAEPFAFIALGIPLAIAVSPILWVVQDGQTALESLEFAGLLTAITAPPLLIGLRKERYNLHKKWRIETQ